MSNLPTTSEAAETTAQDQAVIDQLLGQDGESPETPATETKTEEPAEQTEATEASEEAEAAEETSEEAADEAEEAEEEAEEAEEESDLTLDESDRDYSQAAYEKAAKFYSQKLKVQFDPNDPKDRVTLGRLLADRDALAKQREELEAKPKVDETKKADEAPVEAAKVTPEQIEQVMTQFGQVAEKVNVPEVAMHNATKIGSALVKLLWPGEKIDFKPTQEAANELNKALTTALIGGLEQFGPMMMGVFKDGLGADPVWGTVQRETIQASAFEHLDKTLGTERFADLETLVNDGTIKSIMSKNPQIFQSIKAGDGRDPIMNEAARIEAAYKFARGEKTLDQVKEAVKTGEKKATAHAKKIAAGRVAPGTPKGGFAQPASEGSDLIRNITQGPGSTSRFSAAVKSQLKK